jgi:hypothetical protein
MSTATTKAASAAGIAARRASARTSNVGMTLSVAAAGSL